MHHILWPLAAMAGFCVMRQIVIRAHVEAAASPDEDIPSLLSLAPDPGLRYRARRRVAADRTT